jgi:hypothetical protein
MPDARIDKPSCRPHCGACCIAPSISTPIPSPAGGPARPKAAGEACPQLDDQRRCRLFDHPDRPAICASLRPSAEMCGPSAAHAMHWLARLEQSTLPTMR